MVSRNKRCPQCNSSFNSRNKLCWACNYIKRKKWCIEYKRCIWCKKPSAPGRNYCRQCIQQMSVNAQKRNHRLTTRIRCGITLLEKKKMYNQQKGLCGLCGKPLPKDFHRAHTDHKPNSSVVRSVLHQRCNILLGYLESPLYKKALKYLEKFS